jgi:rhodanese-related sulfurtransferase
MSIGNQASDVVSLVTIDQCRQLIESGRRLRIIDVRTPGEFARVHVAGAVLMPLDQLNCSGLAAGPDAGDDPIYVICHAGARSAKACQRMTEAGVANVHSIEGGTAAWEKAGLPIERAGSNAISLERQVRIAAGSIVLVGLALAWILHPAFAGLSALIGAGLVFAGMTDTCAMGMLLMKMPWNRGPR